LALPLNYRISPLVIKSCNRIALTVLCANLGDKIFPLETKIWLEPLEVPTWAFHHGGEAEVNEKTAQGYDQTVEERPSFDDKSERAKL